MIRITCEQAHILIVLFFFFLHAEKFVSKSEAQTGKLKNELHLFEPKMLTGEEATLW